jgi:hypothetical protein
VKAEPQCVGHPAQWPTLARCKRVLSRDADAAHLYGLDTKHDPCRASALAWRTGGDDNGLVGALQPPLQSPLAIRCSRDALLYAIVL